MRRAFTFSKRVSARCTSRALAHHASKGAMLALTSWFGLASSGFGELALLYSAPRAATVTATADCQLWVMERAFYNAIKLAHTQAANQEKRALLDGVPLLALLRPVSIAASNSSDCLCALEQPLPSCNALHLRCSNAFDDISRGTVAFQCGV